MVSVSPRVPTSAASSAGSRFEMVADGIRNRLIVMRVADEDVMRHAGSFLLDQDRVATRLGELHYRSSLDPMRL